MSAAAWAGPPIAPWLQPLADLATHVRAEQLAPRFPHPPADARPAAVLICFSDGPGGRQVLLTQRPSSMRSHAGQISFPGGARDATDASPRDTALREAHEEVGLRPDEVVVFGELPTLWLPPSNFAVTPVLGWRPQYRALSGRSPLEVERVLEPSLDDLLDPARRFTVVNPSGWRGPGFDIDAAVPLWGFTAGVLARLFDVVGWAQPWDESIERPLPEVP